MYTQLQENALKCWLGTKHEFIAGHFDTENSEQGDEDNIELAKAWFDAVTVSPEFIGRVFRGLRANHYCLQHFDYLKYLFTLNQGETYLLTRPCSSTVSEIVGNDWATPNEENKNIDHLSALLICDVVSGRDIRGGPKHEEGDEEEIVLLNTTKFIVTKVGDEKDILNNGEGRIKQKILWLKEI